MYKFELVQGNDSFDSQMLYFTTKSITDDERHLFFLSNQSGTVNAYSKDLETGEIKKLSDNAYGLLKGYAAFNGDPEKGFGICALDTARKLLYYLQDNNLIKVGIDGERKLVARMPEHEYCTYPHVSSDGRFYCVATNEKRIIDGFDQLKSHLEIDARVRREHLSSYLNVYDTQTGEQVLRERVSDAWITHVQFSPIDHNLILYNHEWTSVDCGIRRVWLFNGKEHMHVRKEGEGRSREDWTCHEFWSECGRYVYYHGKLKDVHAYVGRYDYESGEIREIPLDSRYSHMYGHFSVNKDGIFVSDGYYGDLLVAEKDRPKGSPIYDSAYLSIQKPDWDKKSMEVIPLGKHNSSWRSQDTHPHPIFNQKGDTIYFTSDMDGKRKIYKCKWTE